MKLTVFTPTYNRAHTLTQLYESLKKQSDMRFEWLIVDDGSTDNTDELVNQFIAQNHDFLIRYYKQNHGGKPRAQNMAVDLAAGDFFITCDSNKYLDNDGVKRILTVAEAIKDEPMICGVGGYRADFAGNVYGGEMVLNGAQHIDCSSIDRAKYNLLGDKATAFKTDILRRYKSPEFPGETFVTEAVWLLPMAKAGYVIRWFPEIIIYGEYAQDGLTKQGANSYIGHFRNFLGFLAYVSEEIDARGFYAVTELVSEALAIAHEKKMPLQEVADRLRCTVKQLKDLQKRNALQRIYQKLPLPKSIFRKILGDKITENIKRRIKV